MFHYLDNFRKNIHRLSKYGVSFFDCENAINETCEFFGMPPAIIGDLTGVRGGQTMFVNLNRNRQSLMDDAICYDMEQLKDLGVTSKDAFSLVMTHECTHRLLQNTTLPGLNKGQWEQELCCDFFMGVRCYAITYVGYMDLIQKRRRSIAEYLQIFEKWRQEHADEIRQAQIPFYG